MDANHRTPAQTLSALTYTSLEQQLMPYVRLLLGIAAMLALSGCEVIRTIFDAGMWVGVIGILVLLGIVGFVLSLFRR